MTPKPPSARQLDYLRALANRTGQTFTYPRTSRDASREIQRLKASGASILIEASYLPDATLAWLLWHIEWWWNDISARVARQPGLSPSDHSWSGSTAGIVAAKHDWDRVLSEADLDVLVQWRMPQPQPVWFIASWVNVELTKNLAEISQLKGLRLNR